MNEIEKAGRMFEKWAPQTNREQLIWVREYLTKSDSIKAVLDSEVEPEETTKDKWTFDPEGPYEYPNYNAMSYRQLTIWMRWFYCHFREGIIEFNKMKSAWSQKKYRSKLKSKHKKAVNFVLSMDTEKKLSYIAKVKRSSINKVLEEIIDNEHQNASSSFSYSDAIKSPNNAPERATTPTHHTPPSYAPQYGLPRDPESHGALGAMISRDADIEKQRISDEKKKEKLKHDKEYRQKLTQNLSLNKGAAISRKGSRN